MNASQFSTRIWILFAGMAALLLPAARCGQSARVNSPAVQGSSIVGSGPSHGITVKVGAGANWSYGSNPPGVTYDRVLEMINGHRLALGLNVITWHDGMTAAAQTHTVDMLTRNLLSIVNPDGVDLFQRLVSSSPRIDFDNSWGFVYQIPVGADRATDLFRAILENTVTRTIIERPQTTHFGNRGSIPGIGTMIFAQNARP